MGIETPPQCNKISLGSKQHESVSGPFPLNLLRRRCTLPLRNRYFEYRYNKGRNLGGHRTTGMSVPKYSALQGSSMTALAFRTITSHPDF